MTDIGLNENVAVEGREFHIQTATQIEAGTIRTEVFERGRLLFTEFRKYERRQNGEDHEADVRLRRVLDEFHHNIIVQIETLFELSAILMNEEHSLSHRRLGAVFLSLHLFEEASRHFLRAIDLEPDDPNNHIGLARCFFMEKRYNDAMHVLDPLLKQKINYPDLFNLAGLIYLEQKNFVHAFNHFRKAIQINSNYKEAYLNLSSAVLQRLNFLRMEGKKEEIEKNLSFLKIIFKKIQQTATDGDAAFLKKLKEASAKGKLNQLQNLVYDYRCKHYLQKVPPENVGYEFYLILRYMPDRLHFDLLCQYEGKISKILQNKADYPDLWNYVALIHLMLCRDYFLKGLDNFKEATKINPRFAKAQKNLRLVENDGREFLALIKAIVK